MSTAILFDPSTTRNLISPTFAAGILPPPVQTDLYGNPLPRVDYTASDAAWWAQERADLEAYKIDMARLEEADYLEWAAAMDSWAATGGPITDMDVYPHGRC